MLASLLVSSQRNGSTLHAALRQSAICAFVFVLVCSGCSRSIWHAVREQGASHAGGWSKERVVPASVLVGSQCDGSTSHAGLEQGTSRA
eukprot:1145133-Pelagomonas_calceolata.AAC.2